MNIPGCVIFERRTDEAICFVDEQDNWSWRGEPATKGECGVRLLDMILRGELKLQ